MKLFMVGYVVILLLSNIILAQEENETLDFTKDRNILPPSPPDENTINIIFEIRDEAENLLSNTHLIFILTNTQTDETLNLLQYTDTGTTFLNIKKGIWKGKLGVDEAIHLGSDYFANIYLDTNEKREYTPHLIHVGNILGEVYDENNRLVKGAKVSSQCTQYLVEDSETDEFGTFLLEYLAPGECRIAALYDDRIGFSTVMITPSTLTYAKIILDQRTVQNNTNLWFIGAVVIIFVFFLFYQFNKNKTKKDDVGQQKNKKSIQLQKKEKVQLPKKEEKNIQQEKNDIDQKRVNDILNSLKAREKQIVTFLLENNYQATQAKIISGTGIPKTSLMRTLDSLVMRNIIQVQKIQKAKKISLTNWFLGME
ncbi:carboxypeptidase regulatory-like domain-containing protein [Candidatus Woesearchaeota archaeon]|nr:carboxypeptidase regulatory-like domain-containing protein [Candidatus Woesearchaeota archaeon]